MSSNANMGVEKTDIIDIIKMYHDDFIYRHTNYWGLVYKSMISILGLMSLPYFLYNTIATTFLIALFPMLSIIVASFSIILMESEAVRMKMSRKQMNNLLQNMSQQYAEIPIDSELTKNKRGNLTWYSKLLKAKITRKILFLYGALIVLSGIEIYLIATQTIFVFPVVP